MAQNFEVGSPVVLTRYITGHGLHAEKRTRVARVYKNGNFVLESDPGQQWRPARNGGAAHATGEHGRYRRITARLLTEELEQRLHEEEETRAHEKKCRELASSLPDPTRWTQEQYEAVRAAFS